MTEASKTENWKFKVIFALSIEGWSAHKEDWVYY